MTWKISFQKTAEEDLAFLDKPVRRRIIDKLYWLVENFDQKEALKI